MYPFGCWPVKASIVPSEEAIDGHYHHVKVDPETVGQYTGVLDWNGKRIFEGDYISGSKYKGVVNFGTGCFCVKGRNYRSNPAIDIVINEDVVVVVGNIYDNPELLEVPDDDR